MMLRRRRWTGADLRVLRPELNSLLHCIHDAWNGFVFPEPQNEPTRSDDYFVIDTVSLNVPVELR
jgi:hypothetical protein